jgi:hypothetical protein
MTNNFFQKFGIKRIATHYTFKPEKPEIIASNIFKKCLILSQKTVSPLLKPYS